MASRKRQNPEAADFEREYPGASWIANRALRELEIVGGRVENLVASVAREFGLSHAALNALAVIEGAGQPVTAGEVGAAMHITTGTMTSVLDTLQRSGYIERLADPTDRRKVLVEITPAAEELLDAMLPRVQQTVTAAMAGVDEEVLFSLLEILATVRSSVATAPNDLPPPPKRRKPDRLQRTRASA